jgi:hypothetical protein
MLHSLCAMPEQWGADLWAERITNRYEPSQVVLVVSDARIRRGVK